LRTGDLGFLLDGQLYVAGRRKEMAIVHGRNFFPDDVESIARDVPGVYKRHCVAIPDNDASGREYLGLIVESAAYPEEQAALSGEIRRRIAAELDLHAVRVYIVAPRFLTRTSSGKWQRLPAAGRLERNSKERFSNGKASRRVESGQSSSGYKQHPYDGQTQRPRAYQNQ
jgi:acyl-CoA synthetase (AMP-forming)/AMP-acid ligase II